MQIKLITEIPRSTFDVVAGISSDVLNKPAMFANCFNETSAAKYLQTSTDVVLFVSMYVSESLFSRTNCFADFLNFLLKVH